MTNEEIEKLNKEVRSADFNFLKKLSAKELVKRLDIIRAQQPKAWELMEKNDTVIAHRAVLQLAAQDDAIVAERMRRFDAGGKI